MLKKALKEALELGGYLPLSKKNLEVKNFEIEHVLEDKDKRIQLKKHITDYSSHRINPKSKGVYVYRMGKKILYVGEGRLRARILNHYKAACGRLGKNVPKLVRELHEGFFSKHLGKIRIYYKVIDGKKLRRAVEAAIEYTCGPSEFELYKLEQAMKMIKNS